VSAQGDPSWPQADRIGRLSPGAGSFDKLCPGADSQYSNVKEHRFPSARLPEGESSLKSNLAQLGQGFSNYSWPGAFSRETMKVQFAAGNL
jgi:hypothetical protein